MNLRYYLRGLGIGIVVTAVIMGAASGGKKETLSNAEIIERAKELGMVEESGLLSDMEESPAAETAPEPEATPMVTPMETPAPEETPMATSTATPVVTPEATATPTATPMPTASPKATPTATPMVTPEATATPTATPKAAAAPEKDLPGQDQAIAFSIASGESSHTICQRLEELGLIASAEEYDRFLYENGYDKKLRIGDYEIPAGTGEEEIARMLTAG